MRSIEFSRSGTSLRRFLLQRQEREVVHHLSRKDACAAAYRHAVLACARGAGTGVVDPHPEQPRRRRILLENDARQRLCQPGLDCHLWAERRRILACRREHQGQEVGASKRQTPRVSCSSLR